MGGRSAHLRGALLRGARPGPRRSRLSVPPFLDHLVYAWPALDEGVREVERRLGVRPAEGGRHEGLGTRNALVSLGPSAYLEVVSVDAEQPAPERPRWFGLDGLRAPRLVTWAARRDDLPEVVARAAALGLELGAVTPAARRRPDGVELRWFFTDPRAERGGGVVPFFIDWGASPHPADGLPVGCSLAELTAVHPEPDATRAVLERLGVPLEVRAGPEPGLVALLESPRGLVELR